MIICGLLLKINKVISNHEIIELLRLTEKIDSQVVHITFDELVSDDFNALGILKFSNLYALVIHRNLGYTCSFEGSNMYGLDLRLQSLSEQGEILCFMSNPYSETFGYAYFKNGARIANQAMAGGEILEGSASSELEEISLSETGILKFVEKTGDFSFIDLVELPKSEIQAFNLR